MHEHLKYAHIIEFYCTLLNWPVSRMWELISSSTYVNWIKTATSLSDLIFKPTSLLTPKFHLYFGRFVWRTGACLFAHSLAGLAARVQCSDFLFIWTLASTENSKRSIDDEKKVVIISCSEFFFLLSLNITKLFHWCRLFKWHFLQRSTRSNKCHTQKNHQQFGKSFTGQWIIQKTWSMLRFHLKHDG